MQFHKHIVFLLISLFAVAFSFCVEVTGAEKVREWTDSSGHYTVDAMMIAYDDEHVVLQKESGNLISMLRKDLSEQDREYVATAEKKAAAEDSSEEMRTYAMRNGMKVRGMVVDFAERDVTIQFLRKKVYVNDRLFKNLPEIYQKIVPQIIAHFEDIEIKDEIAMTRWARRNPREGKTFTCQGVLFELQSGDQYGVPFFLFSEGEAAALKPGFDRWRQAKGDDEKQDKESFYLKAQTQSQKTAEAQASDVSAIRQISEVQLQLQAYDAGLFDLWEVMVFPPGGQGRWLTVVVPGRDSRQAGQNALQKYPGSQLGAIAKVRRRGQRR